LYHTIEFTKELVIVLLASLRWEALGPMPIPRGTRRQAQVKPHVAETEDGFVEMADLLFEDGTATRDIPFACFSFVE
jgi:hypothetical protein